MARFPVNVLCNGAYLFTNKTFSLLIQPDFNWWLPGCHILKLGKTHGQEHKKLYLDNASKLQVAEAEEHLCPVFQYP